MAENVSSVKVNWLNTIFLVITPILAVLGLILDWSYFGAPGLLEFVIFILFYYACGLSITVGYHRLFSHRSHEASWPLVLFYSIFGAGAFQNSIIEWCSDHRNHHKSTDSDDDPYSASRGFWYSHMGWILIEQDKFQNDFSNVKDLEQSKIIRWQHRNIFLIGAFSGIIAPALLGYLIGGVSSAIGGLVWGGLVRLVFVHHGTFLINSAAHIWGTQPYSEENSSKDSFWLAFLTFGEGYHNFHHTFQADYRNGHKWYHVDPSKWWIGIFSMLRLKSNLKKTPKHSIEVAKLDMKFKKTANKLSSKNIDVSIFEKQVDNYRKSMRACLFEIHKARKELKEAMKNQSESIREKIVEIKLSYKQIKDELRIMFKEMNQQYRGISV
ncbi:MAG: acyl-CoA desaturase [Euryarchaeota archaeon]|jgi:stearoyl-CoA desaturase (delta-9 desaturase)|nr:acyl-CoA desaturase [Euryarchaeota archaeon]MBT4925149.1 acyl-CoA desaturase [Euryarchaeota archaeon]MBT5735652.1 acyl-CoA desaturase [Euryarchaeota archaeon]